MKEAITKFDLEAAFKALDEIDIPKAGRVKANRPALTEIFSRKTKFDSLMEEYYDISNNAELNDAKEAREAEVAKAKLERIEKIVDLDANSPEDLLTSYVGKYIIQCPQCMTLFYKDKEDVVESEEDPTTVNVNEVCQHCGNESGYTLVGKVGEAEAEASAEELDMPAEELPVEEPSEEEVPTEENAEESEDLGDLEALDLDLNLEDDEDEKKEESFVAHDGETLVEELADDPELDDKLEAHSEYIEYLRAAIAQEEEKLEKATNEQVKVALQRNIDAFKADLEAALPEAVKNDTAIAEKSTEEISVEEVAAEEVAEEPAEEVATEVTESLTESLHEEADLDVSAEEFEELINSPEFKRPISDSKVRAMMNDEKEAEESVKESVKVNNETLEYAVINPDGTYAGVPCTSAEEARELAAQKDGRVVAELKETTDVLKEGIFDLFKTRAGKAEWIIKNAKIDYNKAVANKNSDDKSNQKYSVFVVVSYKDTDIDDKKIDKAPKPADRAKLVPNTKYPEVKTEYADAETIAKGRSMKSDGGPAFIYLAKDANDNKAEFLCQYFDGKLDAASDRMDTIIENIKKDMKGSKLEVKGGSDQSEVRAIKAEAVKPGMKVQVDNEASGEITKVAKVNSRLVQNQFAITVKYSDGKSEILKVDGAFELNILRDSITNESLEATMSDLEDLHESSLETLISTSLVEAYGNVAGFRLTECNFADNKFTVDGTIYFTSGNTRKTTYAFSEAYVKEGKVSMCGLNEKLGLDKQFTLTGRIDNKTLITESFKRSK